MKILRFNDDRIGVLKGEDRVVDVSGEISYRVEKGPKRAIEEVIEGFEHYRDKFQRIVDRENGVPLSTVKLLAPIPQPNKCLAAFANYTTEYMAYKIPDQIAWLSKYVQLCPGDVIATGTYHPGLGPFNGGDLLEIEIERLGKCSFNVKGYGAKKFAKSSGGRESVNYT